MRDLPDVWHSLAEAAQHYMQLRAKFVTTHQDEKSSRLEDSNVHVQ